MVFWKRKKKSQEETERAVTKPLRRKRKETPIIWGRKERLLVFCSLLITAAFSFFLAASARDWKLPGLPRFGLPKISFLGEEKLYFSDKSGLARQETEVTSEFLSLTKNVSGVWGLLIIDPKDGSAFGVNRDESFQAASLIKLPVMAAVYLDVSEGRIDLDDKPEGSDLTFRELVSEMGKKSNNQAQITVVNALGEERIDEVISLFGMKNTSYDQNLITPEDIGLFFEELWQGSLIPDDSRDELLAALTDTIYEEWLAEGVPAGVRVAHKFGREVHVVNDAGIVFAQKPYVVVILSKGVVEREADDLFPMLSKAIYEKLQIE